MSDTKFNYMLLNRLQSDCYSYLNGGGGLWGVTPQSHIEKMIELYEGLEIKPQWLTAVELDSLAYRLAGIKYLTQAV